MSRPAGTRVRSVDWLRGGAVAVMVQAHALAFLSAAHDDDPIRDELNVINGLPAPAFLFAAGFSLALVTARAGPEPWADRWRRDGRARRSLRRIGVVFLASLLLRHVLWATFAHPERFAWIDVLSCIGLMLLALWAVLFVLPPVLRAWALAGMAMLAIGFSPWAAAPRTFGPLTPLLTNTWESNTWPLVPWAAYGWIGALVGLAVGASAWPRRTMERSLAWIVTGGVVAFLTAGPIIAAIDGDVSAWIVANLGDRLWRIAVLLLAMAWLDARLPATPGPVQRWINLLSRQSLVAYVGHQVLLFGWGWFRPFNRFLFREDWPMTLALIACVLALTTALCAIVERWPLSPIVGRAWRSVRRGLRSS